MSKRILLAVLFLAVAYASTNGTDTGRMKFLKSSIAKDVGDAYKINITCHFEGTPRPTIKWVWKRDGAVTKITTSNFFVYNTNTSNGTVETLMISNREFLGNAEIGCYAQNPNETSEIEFALPNSDLIFGERHTYQLVNQTHTSHQSSYFNVCSNMSKNMLQISDNYTQNVIAEQLSVWNLESDVLIDLERRSVNGTMLWVLSNGSTVSDDSGNGDRFTAWGGSEPSSLSGDCVVLKKSIGWLWAVANCSQAGPYLCQSPVVGPMKDFRAVVEECESEVAVSFVPGDRVDSVTHLIEVVDNRTRETLHQKHILPSDRNNNTVFQSFSVQKGSTYDIKVTVCPNCPTSYRSSLRATTDTHVGPQTRTLSDFRVTHNGSECILNWDVNQTGVIGFQITATENPRLTGWVKTREWTIRLPRSNRSHIIETNPIGMYTFTLQAETCSGLAPGNRTSEQCITDAADSMKFLKSSIARDAEDGYKINITCRFESTPRPTIIWVWRQDGALTNITASINMNSNFFVYNTNTSSETVGTLTIRNREFLGNAEIGCYAQNPFETSEIKFTQPNSDLIFGESHTYELVNKTRTSNQSSYSNVCSNMSKNMLQIPDNYTQNSISQQLSIRNLESDVLIDLEKHIVNGTVSWVLGDGSHVCDQYGNGDRTSNQYERCGKDHAYFIALRDNASCYDQSRSQWKHFACALDEFTAWGESEPSSSSGDCVVLKKSTGWLWAVASCSQPGPYICQSSVVGPMKDFRAVVEECESEVDVNFVPGDRLDSIIHLVEVVDNRTGETLHRKHILPSDWNNNAVFQAFKVSNGSTYDVKVTVCPNCPTSYRTALQATTDTYVAPETRALSDFRITHNGSECILNWDVNQTGVVGFQILATESPRLIGESSLKTRELTIRLPRSRRTHIVETNPNSIYSFTAQAKTCNGLAPGNRASEQCVTDVAAPVVVSVPLLMSRDRENKELVPIGIAIPDQRSGPVSCLFVIVNLNSASANASRTYDLDEMKELARKSTSSENLLPGDDYLAVAIPRTDFSDTGTSTSVIPWQLGDDSTTQCDASNVDDTSNNGIQKRDLSAEVLTARNKRIAEGRSYSFIVAATTPGDSTIHVKTSDPVMFSRKSIPHVADTGLSDGAVIAMVVLLLVLGSIVMFGISYDELRKKSLDRNAAGDMTGYHSDGAAKLIGDQLDSASKETMDQRHCCSTSDQFDTVIPMNDDDFDSEVDVMVDRQHNEKDNGINQFGSAPSNLESTVDYDQLSLGKDSVGGASNANADDQNIDESTLNTYVPKVFGDACDVDDLESNVDIAVKLPDEHESDSSNGGPSNAVGGSEAAVISAMNVQDIASNLTEHGNPSDSIADQELTVQQPDPAASKTENHSDF